MRINLLPADLRPQPLLNPKRIILILVGLLLIIAELGYLGTEYMQLTTEKSQLSNILQQLDSLQETKESIQKAELKRQNILKQKEEILKVYAQYKPYLSYIREVANALKNDIWITSISFEPSKISLKGDTIAFPFIGDFLKKLLEVDLFEKARLQSVNEFERDDVKGYDFQIEITTKGGL